MPAPKWKHYRGWQEKADDAAGGPTTVASASPYRLVGAGDPTCEHFRLVPMPDGENLFTWWPVASCPICRPRMNSMIRQEAEYVFSRAVEGRAFRCDMPREADRFARGWHLAVGAKCGAAGAVAFVIVTTDSTIVVATEGLWGGSGHGMTKARWREESVAEARARLYGILGEGQVLRGEMWYRPRFWECLLDVGRGRWVLPMIPSELAELAEMVS